MSNEKDALKELRAITKNKECWKENTDNVASKLNENYSSSVKAKALWILGEMGLKYPEEIEGYVNDIVCYMERRKSQIAGKINKCSGKNRQGR